MNDTDGAGQPEANGNADTESHAQSTEEEMPETVPHAQAPQETPNLLDQPRWVVNPNIALCDPASMTCCWLVDVLHSRMLPRSLCM